MRLGICQTEAYSYRYLDNLNTNIEPGADGKIDVGLSNDLNERHPMSIFAARNLIEGTSKIHYSEYIKTDVST